MGGSSLSPPISHRRRRSILNLLARDYDGGNGGKERKDISEGTLALRTLSELICRCRFGGQEERQTANNELSEKNCRLEWLSPASHGIRGPAGSLYQAVSDLPIVIVVIDMNK